MNRFLDTCLTGDCEILLVDFDDGCVDLIFTSPPYAGIKNKYQGGYAAPSPEFYADWIMPKIKEFHRVLSPRGSFILNIDDKIVDGFRDVHVHELVCRIVKETGFKLYERLAWNKGKSLCHPSRFRNPLEHVFWFVKQKGFTLNLDEMRQPYSPVSVARMQKPIKKRFARTLENQDASEYKQWKPHPKGALPSTLLSIGSSSQRQSSSHFAPFPSKLASFFVKGATNHGDFVLDPFAGTFTTCIAAKALGRRFCGIDISEDYVKEAQSKLQSL